MSAQTRIAEFATAPAGPCAFPAIARADIVAGLRERIADPTKIDTSNANLCGPAAFFYCLVNDDPDLYVRYVIDLYCTGRARLGSIDVSPGHDCRHYRPDKSVIAPVDWVALASLRDSENSALDYDHADTAVGGITMPHSMTRWFKACGYAHVRDTTSVWIRSDEGAFEAMGHYYLQGRWVCLFINDNLLHAKSETDWSMFPNHWVVLTSPVPVIQGHTSFSVFSWGQTNQIQRAEADALTSNLYGYIAAMRKQIGDFPLRGGAAAG